MTNGQTLPDSLLVSGSVPGFSWLAPDTVADSLRVLLLDHAIALAEMEERRTSLWYRLIPDVRLSANIGVQQLVFIDPAAFTPYVLPKDAYRLTVSLSLSDVFNFDKHTAARIQREKLQTQRQLIIRNLQRTKEKHYHTLALLQLDLQSLKQQQVLIDDLDRYTQILFDQGDITFNELVRVRLQQLHIKHTISRLIHSIGDFQPEP
jgi:hypothetical protein